jgi:hypothetical protein
LAVLMALSIAGLAGAELTQKGDLFVRFDGGIAPKALPRHALAPIAVRLEGRVRTPPGKERPALNHIRIALNSGGRLHTRGLPVCHRAQIASASSSEALAVCGDALVGSGGIVANTSFPDQQPYLLRGEMTFFNGVRHGHAIILAHVFQSTPAPITNIVTFEVHRSGGAFGTVIDADLPPALEHNGYLESIFLRLQRTFLYRGRSRAYLSASCPAPNGFSAAAFPFAKASMSFDDGRVLSATLTRTCRASG